jgi:S1-C subfamily serine protease
LGFLTGAHNYYNRSSDDFWWLNYSGQANVVKFVRDVILELDHRSKPLTFLKTENQHKHGKYKFKLSLGVMPDYAFTGKGLLLEAVRKNRAAEKAGLQSGDIIIKFGSVKINNIYDYVAALRMFKPGDKVELVFIRDGKEMTTEVLLEK